MYFGNWSCGNNKSVQVDDRVFLIRLAKEPRGIVASGWADSESYERKHWDTKLAAEGKTTRFIDVRFDTLLDAGRESILPRRSLDVLGRMHWDSESSGILIPAAVAVALEDAWADFLGNDRRPIPLAEPSALEGLRTETVKYARGCSRQLRDLALRESNGICSVCDVDYRELLNGDGVRVLQVHHRKQLASNVAPMLTKLSDLAVVCANCHMLIHMDAEQAIPVEKLREMLGKSF